MRLSKIKLAGFKSFVDPTTVYLKSNLVGVVGPNGSGKSNIIDAVRWVMGESSAKHLRGESMADVIFSGSSSRKPVGQASIELVFDNKDGGLGGKYASYNEISVKRLVSRDGQSVYYLNGTRCRRRDITDIFLGTGLGPRSYAIIEQGMISRMIEAKPEDLRVTLEEAAGISKYKERRKETESRIKHTRENLDRIIDIKDELNKQLERLQRQARTAERYKKLKVEERELEGQLSALKWQEYDQQAKLLDQEAAQTETQLQAEIASQRSLEAALEKQRETHTEKSDLFNEVQGRFYQLGAEISNKEQTIQHSKERRYQLEQDIKEIEKSLNEALAHQGMDQTNLKEYESKLEQLQPELEKTEAAHTIAQERLEEREHLLQELQARWEQLNEDVNAPAREADVVRTQIQNLEEQVHRHEVRVQKLQEELKEISTDSFNQQAGEMREAVETVRHQLEQQKEIQQALAQQLSESRDAYRQQNDKLQELRSLKQKLEGRVSSLEALQEAALGRNNNSFSQWIKNNQLADLPRLAQLLDVETTWEKAVETVLGNYLDAVCVDGQMDELSRGIGAIDGAHVNLIERRAGSGSRAQSVNNESLLNKVNTDLPIDGLLEHILCAQNLEQALSMRAQLLSYQSIITADGIWLGPNWLRVNKEHDAQEGILHREKELKAAVSEIQQLDVQISALTESVGHLQDQVRNIEDQQSDEQQNISSLERELRQKESQISGVNARLEQLNKRREQIESEIGELSEEMEQAQAKVMEMRAAMNELLGRMGQLSEERDELARRRDEARQVVSELKVESQTTRHRFQETNIAIKTISASLESTQQSLGRIDQQIGQFQERIAQSRESLAECIAPFEQYQQELENLLAARMDIDSSLKEARQTLEAVESEVQELNNKRQTVEQLVNEVRDRLQVQKMNAQTVKVKRQSIQEDMQAHGHDIQQIFESISDEFNLESCANQLTELGEKIKRLGAINLAAIDEYKEQSERAVHLEAQYKDLVEALTTLENAIRKIDKETRAKFKETFDLVNNGLKRMFPKLFGGGQAFLELIGEDLLDTGVAIMARPPGKRVSNIHLLSGGEKALTAVALVFAIFELNPAPFCMLDEVDAPLDEANVGRFSNLVKDMSEHVQFIFITHNKATMEIARHLNGVTMHEPGVSRMVAVDVEEAVELAAM